MNGMFYKNESINTLDENVNILLMNKYSNYIYL